MTKDEPNCEYNKSNMNVNLVSYHKPMNSTMLQFFYLLKIASKVSELFKDTEPTSQKRELIGLLGSNFFLDGKKVEVTLYSPFNSIVSCNEHLVWLTCL